MLIDLDEKEIALAKEIAQIRNDKPTHYAQRFSWRPPSRIHFESALGEVAVAKYKGWEIDKAKRLGGDGGVDFSSGGKTVDVKTRNPRYFRHPDLAVRMDHATADFYILTEVDFRVPEEVVIIGYCTGKALRGSRPVDIGYGPRYFVKRKDLRPISQLNI